MHLPQLRPKKDADGNLSGETEISTGLSDGSTVEITDGLEEGAAVYYQRTGNVSETNGSQMPGNMADNPGSEALLQFRFL